MSPLVLTIALTRENMRKLCWRFRMVHTQARGSFPSMHLTVKRFNPTRAYNLGSLCVCVFQIERGREGGRAWGGRASLSRARCARAPRTEGWSRARRPHRVMLSARRETCARVTFSGVGSAVSVRASGRRERRLPPASVLHGSGVSSCRSSAAPVRDSTKLH